MVGAVGGIGIGGGIGAGSGNVGAIAGTAVAPAVGDSAGRINSGAASPAAESAAPGIKLTISTAGQQALAQDMAVIDMHLNGAIDNADVHLQMGVLSGMEKLDDLIALMLVLLLLERQANAS